MINDYDHFAAQRQEALKKGQSLPHRFVEKPAMASLIGDLTNKKVLMLGCGTGEESLLLEKHGASELIGVDLSAESVRLANASYPKHKFFVADMHSLSFADESFDFVYSSLTIHYSGTPLEVYKEVMRVLKPAGTFQFSVGHPMRWASERVKINDVPTKLMGYSEGEGPLRLYGSYSDFQEYEEAFGNGEVLRFWIGPPSMHFNSLREAGFEVTDFIETQAIQDCRDVNEDYFRRFSNFPQFTIFSAMKPAK